MSQSQPETELSNAPESLADIGSRLEATGEVLDDGGEEDEDEGEDEQVADDGDDDDAEQPAAAVDEELEFEVDGKPVKLKKSELPKVYREKMLESDYRQKTTELAEQRRQIEHEAQVNRQEREARVNQLDVFIGALHRDLVGSQPDQSLIESDPQEFLRQTAFHNSRAQQFNEAIQARQSIGQQQTADDHRKQAEYRDAQQKLLYEAMPAWKDETVRVKEAQETASYLAQIGYSNEELGQLDDHRALIVARDAAKWRQYQAAKTKQTPIVPPVTKTMRPGVPPAPTADKQARLVDAKKAARRNPNSLDALVNFANAKGI